MGYRCPGCGKDFGFDKETFDEHLQSNEDCGIFAGAIQRVVNSVYGRNVDINTAISKRTVHKSYSRISPNHVWEKQNLVSHKDGSDTVICSRCGIKAKRFFNNYKFDMRQSINKIENCIDRKEE